MIDIKAPEEQEGTKAVVRAWLKQVGDTVAENDPLVELETDKVAQEVPAPAAGVLAEIILEADAEAEPGAILGRLEPVNGASIERPAVSAPAMTTPAAVSSSEDIPLSPAVRRAVREHNIDPSTIEGTGRGGRITRADVDAAVSVRAKPSSIPTKAPAPEAVGGVRTVPHDRMRRTIAENMVNSVTAAPHVTAVFEADFSAIMAHRNASKAALAAKGVNLTFTAYIVSAAAKAMAVSPAINGRWFDDKVELYDDVNIGVGTALGEAGLVVPVIRRVQDMTVEDIAARLTDLTIRARENKLTPQDMRGGTFTISNHGVSGSLIASPIIINQPQSAILGVGKLEKRVVVREVGGADAIQIRPMSYVSLTIDHRIVDGHQTNAWLTKFVDILESWPA